MGLPADASIAVCGLNVGGVEEQGGAEGAAYEDAVIVWGLVKLAPAF
jgi:hypothetical protein